MSVMPKIKINEEILLSASKKVQNQISELNAYNGKLAGLLNEIHTGWIGKASNQYFDLMSTYHKKAVHMETLLAAFKKYADTAVTKFQTLDQDCANKINNSF